MSLATASQAARAAVTSFEDDYYKKRKFDAYLHFSSPEDEEEFRRREAERKAEIDKAHALHTPEGDLRAAHLAVDQMRDAGAHGADASPDYRPGLDKIMGAVSDLKSSMAAKPKVEAKKSESLAATDDPLDAIAPIAPIPIGDIAKLRAAGVTLAEQGEGHGVAANVAQRDTAQRSPT